MRSTIRRTLRALNPFRPTGHAVSDALYVMALGAAVGIAGAFVWEWLS